MNPTFPLSTYYFQTRINMHIQDEQPASCGSGLSGGGGWFDHFTLYAKASIRLYVNLACADHQKLEAGFLKRRSYDYSITHPWLTMIDCPVNASVFCWARNTAVSAISSVVVNWPSTASFNMTF